MTWPRGKSAKVQTDQTAKKGCGGGGGNGSALATIVQAAAGGYRSSAAKLGQSQNLSRAQSHADANRSFTRAYLHTDNTRTSVKLYARKKKIFNNTYYIRLLVSFGNTTCVCPHHHVTRAFSIGNTTRYGEL